MSLGIVDLIIIIFLILGGIVGFKNGAIKEGSRFIGFFAIVIISFLLKDNLMVVLYENLPFINFFGFIQGLTALNILFYQLISFLIIFMALLFILRVIIVITGLIEWLIKMTVFLSLPSKILGTVIGVIEYYVYIFLVLYVLTIPIFNLTFISNSTLANTMLENTPILSGLVDDTVSVYSKVWGIIKDKKENKLDINQYETNQLVLATLLDNNLITIESAKELVSANKIVVEDESFLDNYTSNGDFYDKIKSLYHEYEKILEFRISTVGETKTKDDIEIKINSMSDSCAQNGTCDKDDLINLNITIKKGTQVITKDISTDGHQNKVEGTELYIYAEIESGWVNIGVSK